MRWTDRSGSGAMVAALALCVASAAHALESVEPSLYVGPYTLFDPGSDPAYAVPEDDLARLPAYRGAAAGPQHFCLLGYRWPDGHAFVSVHWREGPLILRWYGRGSWDDDALGWHVHKGVDLVSGVIDADDPGGSTFLETRRDAEGTIAACARHGRLRVIDHAPAAPADGP